MQHLIGIISNSKLKTTVVKLLTELSDGDKEEKKQPDPL